MKPVLVIGVNGARFFLTNRVNLANRARSRGFRVIVMCPNSTDVPKIRALGFEHRHLNLSRTSLNPVSELATFASFLAAFKSIRPDVYHGFTIKCVLYGGLAARILRVPKIILTITGLGAAFSIKGTGGKLLKVFIGLFYKYLLRGSARFVFQNSDDFDLFTRQKKWVRREESKLILGTGVDLSMFRSPVHRRSALPIILFVSRLTKDKGIHELMAACEQLYLDGYEFRLRICGEADPDSLTAIDNEVIESWQKRPFAEFLGFQNDLRAIFAASHIVCLPSYREGIPQVLMEACASARPIVATDVPGCREVVENEFNGILVEPRKVPGLKKALARLIMAPSLRQQMGARGRVIAEKKFNMHKVSDQNIALYGYEQAHLMQLSEHAPLGDSLHLPREAKPLLDSHEPYLPVRRTNSRQGSAHCSECDPS